MSDDHLCEAAGGERLPCTWRALDEHVLLPPDQTDEALEVFHNHLSAANHLGLLAEEVDPATTAPLGNSPQAFSHLGLIQAAARLDLALRLRDEGIDDPPYLGSDFPNQS